MSSRSRTERQQRCKPRLRRAIERELLNSEFDIMLASGWRPDGEPHLQPLDNWAAARILDAAAEKALHRAHQVGNPGKILDQLEADADAFNRTVEENASPEWLANTVANARKKLTPEALAVAGQA